MQKKLRGGCFDEKNEGLKSRDTVPFRYAVEKINHNPDVLSESRLSAQIEWIPTADSFHASTRGTVCTVYLTI
jgi:hypothetical protein